MVEWICNVPLAPVCDQVIPLSTLFGLQPDYRFAAMFRDIKDHVLTT